MLRNLDFIPQQCQCLIFKSSIFINNLYCSLLDSVLLNKNQIRFFDDTLFEVLDDNYPNKLTIIYVNIVFHFQKYVLTDDYTNLITYFIVSNQNLYQLVAVFKFLFFVENVQIAALSNNEAWLIQDILFLYDTFVP